MKQILVIDSHSAGEPTRVVVSGGPPLRGSTLAEQLAEFRESHDDFRSAIVNEPRGSDVLVGALLCEPLDAANSAGVIFFNNVGYLGMCGHGTIGLMSTLAYLGRIEPGIHGLETPVGTITAELHEDGRVSVHNVPAYRHLAGVRVELPDGRAVVGDVAWVGNWFFLTEDHNLGIHLDNVEELTGFAWQIRSALAAAGVTGANGMEIDHIELFAATENADSRNFVLCPGKAYDRSPCGTGTSAKLACLHADGKLQPGQTWRQESVLGSSFDAYYTLAANGQVQPVITGQAFITAENTLLLHPDDPFRWGIT
jgi:4-hydroxyproline epimerase